MICGDLGGDIRQIIVHGPAGMRWGKQQQAQLIKSFVAMIDQLEISNQHAFFGKVLGTGGHGAGRNSANFRVMRRLAVKKSSSSRLPSVAIRNVQRNTPA